MKELSKFISICIIIGISPDFCIAFLVIRNAIGIELPIKINNIIIFLCLFPSRVLKTLYKLSLFSIFKVVRGY